MWFGFFLKNFIVMLQQFDFIVTIFFYGVNQRMNIRDSYLPIKPVDILIDGFGAPIMKTALLFDIDSTLTPPRLPITESMVQVLRKLNVPFHVAAGSHMELLEEQFFKPLFKFGFRGRFEAFISNGAIQYHCDYSSGSDIHEVDLFDIRKHLGNEAYDDLVRGLENTVEIPGFQLPGHLKVYGDVIAYRISMVNFSPIGRVKVETPEVRENREAFVCFDKETNYRRNILDHFDDIFSDLMAEKDLKITLGGQTSFDVGILGQDKSKAVRMLLASGVQKLIFIGDALFEGGNDAVIREYIDDMPPDSTAKAEYFQVESYKETEALLKEYGFVKER